MGPVTEETLTKDAKPRKVAVGGGDPATSGEEGRGGLGVKSWVQSQSQAEKGASPDGAAAGEHIPSLSAPLHLTSSQTLAEGPGSQEVVTPHDPLLCYPPHISGHRTGQRKTEQ